MSEEPQDFSFDFEVRKTNADQMLVFGYAQLSKAAGSSGLMVDSQGDYIEPTELEKAAYEFVATCRVGGDMHVRKGTGELVESIVFTDEKRQALATDPTTGKVDEVALAVFKATIPDGWWVGYRISDPVQWEMVKSGERPMFSVHGRAKRRVA